jgi:hypothetical protein
MNQRTRGGSPAAFIDDAVARGLLPELLPEGSHSPHRDANPHAQINAVTSTFAAHVGIQPGVSEDRHAHTDTVHP